MVAMRPSGCRLPRAAWVSGACIGVSTTPGATALTVTPYGASSSASARVAGLMPPLLTVRLQRQGRGDVYDLAVLALAHVLRRSLRQIQHALQVRRNLLLDLFRGELDKRRGG